MFQFSLQPSCWLANLEGETANRHEFGFDCSSHILKHISVIYGSLSLLNFRKIIISDAILKNIKVNEIYRSGSWLPLSCILPCKEYPSATNTPFVAEVY